mgnify:CR=1 FL=1
MTTSATPAAAAAASQTASLVLQEVVIDYPALLGPRTMKGAAPAAAP